MTTFSHEVRSELARIIAGDSCCQLAELTALLRANGEVLISSDGVSAGFTTENASVARKVFTLVKATTGLVAAVMVSRSRKLRRKNRYQVRVPLAGREGGLFDRLGISPVGRSENGEPIRRHCCKKAYLRGAFLGGGTVGRPESNYHLEISVRDENFAGSVVRVMKSMGITARYIMKGEEVYVVYLKAFEKIDKFLCLCGASDAVLRLQSCKVSREMRGAVNRLVNCESYNAERTLTAGYRQLQKIEAIIAAGCWQKLPAELQDTASLRLSHPEASLTELLTRAGGRVSKSLLNYRLRKIEQFADRL
ncbi:MAG: DNA-binding protein WhiA [Negativicutes bacterium]|nr:DNA-binding protein WhiA [Negativicutes bacterium]